jgi:hypothetical protein
MKATSISPQSGQRTAPSDAVVLLHGHPLERNLARAVIAEAAGTFVLVLAITSAAVAAALSRPVAGAPYGSLAVPAAGGLALAIAVASLGDAHRPPRSLQRPCAAGSLDRWAEHFLSRRRTGPA